MSEQEARDQVRAEAARRYPPDHTVDDPFGATGEAQSDEYGYEEYARNAFIAGADWQASRKVEVTTDEREARIERVLKVTDDMRSGGWHSGKTVAEMGQKIYDILTESTNGYVT